MIKNIAIPEAYQVQDPLSTLVHYPDRMPLEIRQKFARKEHQMITETIRKRSSLQESLKAQASLFPGLPKVSDEDRGAIFLKQLDATRPAQINLAKDGFNSNSKFSPSIYNCSLCAVAALVGEGATTNSILSELRTVVSDKTEDILVFAEYHSGKVETLLSDHVATHQMLGIADFLRQEKHLNVHHEDRDQEGKALMAMKAYESGSRFIVRCSGMGKTHFIYGEKIGDELHFIDTQTTPAIHFLNRPMIWSDDGTFSYGESMEFLAVRATQGFASQSPPPEGLCPS